MTPEQKLWQAVVMRAVLDATYTGDATDLRHEKRRADTWLRGRGRDFRTACNLAGLDADFIADAYAAGRVDPDRLRRMESEAA